ncbi:unnamed protein product [Paramecium sonneborni]|uniref:WD40-repeat-containing domain n=1 Tax=Paramecium sonneborni TaxID=65129 RepID=A0A8S1RK09_9CILI|nr:unnamed protein product [Paramecium sonneborni]
MDNFFEIVKFLSQFQFLGRKKMEQKNLYENSQQYKQPTMIKNENDINLNLIDQSVQQFDLCSDIVFNCSGTIMVSTNGLNIEVWSFENGKINLINSLKGHSNYVNCLVYSQKQDIFLSGSGDKTIRIWIKQEQNDWISSYYPSNSGYVQCLLLNKNEDQLFCGNEDKSIKVWQVDFEKKQLNFLYSLEKHEKSVEAISLNQSESKLVSCADGYDQIIIWERGSQNQMVFKYIVNQSIYNYGRKVKFLKENQFIWATASNTEIAKIYVFQLQNGVFEENQEQTIELISNNYIYDEHQFPIVHIKEQNLILVRHKTHIYLIREMNNGQYKIAGQLDCEQNYTVGTLTNNGSHLVYWNLQNKRYSIYELEYK